MEPDKELDGELTCELDGDFAASLTPELRAQEEYLRAQIARHERETGCGS